MGRTDDTGSAINKELWPRLPEVPTTCAGKLAQRTMRRREKILDRQLTEQMRRGRPSKLWRQCNVFGCMKIDCVNTDDFWGLRDKDQSRIGVEVSRYYDEFTTALVKRLWPTLEDAARAEKHFAIESFVMSPPVRAAFWLSRERTKKMKIWSEASIANEIASARSWVEALVSQERPDDREQLIHYYMHHPSIVDKTTWTLENNVMNYFVKLEAWRQYGISYMPKWEFGSAAAIADLHAATLLNFWAMHEDGCFRTAKMGHEWIQFELWEAWQVKYAARPDENDPDTKGETEQVAVEQGVYEGVGRWTPLWKLGRATEGQRRKLPQH